MQRLLVTVLMAGSTTMLCAQAVPDTSITTHGVVRAQREGSFRWGLFLPATLTIRGVALNWVHLDSAASGVANYEDRFVQASGALRLGRDSSGAASAVLMGPQLKARNPEGAVRQNVQLSYTQRGVLTLAVTPMTFTWQDSTGHPTGARPLVLFELVNQSDTPLHIGFPRSEVLCVRVRTLQPGVVADTAWTIVQPGVLQTSLVMGQGYRIIFELPRGAAPVRGRYQLRAELCTATAYGAETTFEITR
jgi:hypothetical protein